MGSKLKHKINPELVQIMSVEAADQEDDHKIEKKVDPGFKFHSEISAPLLWDHFL